MESQKYHYNNNRAGRVPGSNTFFSMRSNIAYSEIVNEVYNIFSDDRQAAAYLADSFGPQYIGLCGWAGAMSPANRAAFVQTFGRNVTDRAEAEARARVDEYRAAVAASAYHLHELEADTFAAYGGSEKSQLPEVGAFVWGRWSCMKGEGGPLGELEDLERMDSEGEENPRRLCEVVAVVDASPSEFLSREYANNVARQFQELGGSRYEETDPRHLDGLPMSWELVFCVRCAGRWYMIDGQGYEYSRYFLMPEDFRQMYAPELATITAAREDEKRRQKEEEHRQAEARRADYLKRCTRWAPLMEDVRPLMEAEKAAYVDREKSQIRKASAKLAAARRRNLVAMASALFPGVKFSAKKWDGWGGSYELTWTDGPTEEYLKEAADFDLFESGRDTFDGMTDCAGVAYSEFTDFAGKYFGLFGEINFNRHESEEFRQSIRDRIRAAVPGLPEGDQERITDGGQLSAICGMFPDVCASYIVQNLERYGLREAVAYITRCMDATPTQDEPTDPNGGGSPTPSYGTREKSQNQEADEWGRTAETQAINAALVVVPAHVMRDFGFIADSGEIVTNPGRAALLHPSRGFVCMPDDGGTPYTPAGGADALAAILRAGGFLNFDEFRFVWPIEHDADTIRRVLAAYGIPEKSQNQDEPTDEIGHPVEYYNGVTWNPADLIGCKQAACILMRQGATWAELEPLDFGGLDLSAVWDEEHPDDEPTGPTDGGEDFPAPSYGETEKSQVPDHLADIYQRAKAKSAEAVALFHCGDWFTAYGEDADRVADAVGIIITTTRDGFRKVSFPFAALDTYLPRMVRQGMKVCICEVPRQAKPLEKAAQEVRDATL